MSDTATLVVHDWETRCSACGGKAWPDEAAHGIGGVTLATPDEGCGAEFVAVALHVGALAVGDQRPNLRLDLPYVGRWSAPTPTPERT